MTTSSRVNDPTRAHASPATRTQPTRIDPYAEARRRALRLILAQTQLTPTALARMAGFPSPNAIYNFLHGRTHSLSANTIARIGEVLPTVDVFQLIRPDRGSGATLLTDHSTDPREPVQAPLTLEGSAVATGSPGVVTREPAIRTTTGSGADKRGNPPMIATIDGNAQPTIHELAASLRSLQAEVTLLFRLLDKGPPDTKRPRSRRRKRSRQHQG